MRLLAKFKVLVKRQRMSMNAVFRVQSDVGMLMPQEASVSVIKYRGRIGINLPL